MLKIRKNPEKNPEKPERRTKTEQETILRWSADEDVSLFTAQALIRRKLERAGYKPWRTSTVAGQEVGWFYRLPLANLRWQAGARKPRPPMSPARRQEAGERFARARLAAKTT